MMKKFKKPFVQCDFCSKPANKKLCVNLVFPACKDHVDLSMEKWKEFVSENGKDFTKW